MELLTNWDAWLHRETQTITKALHASLPHYDSPPSSSPSAAAEPSPPPPAAAAATSASKLRPCQDDRGVPGPQKTLGKRQPRVGGGGAKQRKATARRTTYVEVDAEHFRAMVQQMTGPPPAIVVRPQPKRPAFVTDRFGSDDGFGSVGPAGCAAGREGEFDVDSFLNLPPLDFESSWGYDAGLNYYV